MVRNYCVLLMLLGLCSCAMNTPVPDADFYHTTLPIWDIIVTINVVTSTLHYH